MRFDVVGLGVSTVDLIFTVDQLPGSEMVQRAGECVIAGGGPVATAMVTLARLGAATAMLDSIGSDFFGSFIRSEFAAEGVDTGGLVVAPGRTTSKASILVRKEDGARAITFSPGDAPELTPGGVRADIIRASKILHLNGRHWDACLHAARLAKDAGVLVSFDGGAHRYDPQHRGILPQVDICIAAHNYAAAFAGTEDVAQAAKALLSAGPSIVVVTQGAAGSRVFSQEGGDFHQPAFRVDRVVDTTGAGDAYHGAFLYGLARGFALEESARFASAVAALNTRALGGRAALPTLAEVEKMLQQ
ncbi:carbohydrate kinase family protein [Citrifermentans bremense]|uniref:carbohydrate kinase family protein n=1 Tax=Citrifermentans bremense TaxID=60035 RepID=UPI00041D9022|nr:PfkB family carbohydrate kinase [Citrifermentans bremense]